MTNKASSAEAAASSQVEAGKEYAILSWLNNSRTSSATERRQHEPRVGLDGNRSNSTYRNTKTGLARGLRVGLLSFWQRICLVHRTYIEQLTTAYSTSSKWIQSL